MSKYYYGKTKKVDANQKEIVAEFRKQGATVIILSELGKGCPDLLVGYEGINLLVEVKDGSKLQSQQKLTRDQKEFCQQWKGRGVVVVNSILQCQQLIMACQIKVNEI